VVAKSYVCSANKSISLIYGHRLRIEDLYKDITTFGESDACIERTRKMECVVSTRERAHKVIDDYFDDLEK
jgi:hypothetical protein